MFADARHKATYTEAFRRGWLDRGLGIRLHVALASKIPGYASGYRDGQIARDQNVHPEGDDTLSQLASYYTPR